MHRQLKTTALATAIALMGTAAQASVIGVADPNGSEWLLNIVNTTTNASVNLDLGVQNNNVLAGDYALPSAIQTFISGAGLANITFSVTSGNSGTYDFVTTSAKSNFLTLAFTNSTKTSWNGSINALINNLDSTDATLGSVNNPYGPFTGATSPNYIGGNHYRWGIVSANTVNTGPAQDALSAPSPLALYLVNFDENASLGNAAISSLGTATLLGDKLQISFVPVPASVWLFGSAMGLLGFRRRQAA